VLSVSLGSCHHGSDYGAVRSDALEPHLELHSEQLIGSRQVAPPERRRLVVIDDEDIEIPGMVSLRQSTFNRHPV